MFGFGSSKKDKERRAARKTKNDTAAASRLKKNAASKAAQMKAGAAQRKKIADRNAAIKKRKADATAATKPKKAPVKKKSTANYKAQGNKTVGKGVNLGKTSDDAARLDNRQSVRSSIDKQKTAVAKSATDVTPRPKPGKRGNDSPRAFGTGVSNTIKRDGKALANVTAEQLKASGMSLRGYMNAWKKTGNRPTKK